MTEQDLIRQLAGLKSVRAAVVGDVCLDAYWQADMQRSELSRETPHYTRPVYKERYSGGALANVALNLCDLGVARVSVFTILGRDWRSQLLLDILAEKGIETEHVILDPERLTPMFLKPILEGFQTSEEAERFDFLTPRPPEQEALDQLFRSLEGAISDLDCVLIGDQVLDGIVAPHLVELLCSLARQNRRIVFTADSRYKIGSFQGMVWKPNDIEAARAIDRDLDASETACRLLELGARVAFMTVGEQGCIVAEKSHSVHVPGVRVPPPIDFVGAGDAFHAAVAASLASGTAPVDAAFLGNLAAAVTIAKLGITGTATPEEVLTLAKHLSEQDGPDR